MTTMGGNDVNDSQGGKGMNGALDDARPWQRLAAERVLAARGHEDILIVAAPPRSGLTWLGLRVCELVDGAQFVLAGLFTGRALVGAPLVVVEGCDAQNVTGVLKAVTTASLLLLVTTDPTRDKDPTADRVYREAVKARGVGVVTLMVFDSEGGCRVVPPLGRDDDRAIVTLSADDYAMISGVLRDAAEEGLPQARLAFETLETSVAFVDAASTAA